MIGPILRSGKAPAAWAAVCLVAGILMGGWAATGGRDTLLLAGLALLLLVLSRRGARDSARPTAFALFWLSLGFFAGRLNVAIPAEKAREAFHLLPPFPDRADAVEGVLTDFWSGAPPKARSRLRAERLRVSGQWRPFPAELFLFVSGETPVEPVADRGDRVRVVGHLQLEEVSPSERDIPLPWPRYRLSVKSGLLLGSRGKTLISYLTLPNRFLFRSLSQAPSRKWLADPASFERNVRGPLAALLLGRTSELDRGMVARYRRGGLYHLLVVSGLHVVMAAGLVLLLLHLLRIEGKPRDALLLFSVFLFVLVGGANAPAVRAGLVFAIFFLSRLLERPIGAGQAIGLSALILFLLSPRQIYSIGTILTFAAVTGIALFTLPIRKYLPSQPGWLFAGLATALAAEVATAPILFWRFNLVSVGGWATAPLSIPLSAGLIALGALLLLSSTLGLPAGPLAALFALGCRCLEFLAERAAGVALLRPTPPLAAIFLLGSLLVAAGLSPRRWRFAAAAAAAALFLFLALRVGTKGARRGFSIEALDVGQGDALLVRWAGHTLLVDGGGPFDLEAEEFGRTRLLPKLLDRGVTRLDAVLLTHPHPDHALGLFVVLEELPVGQFWQSLGDDSGDLYRRLASLAERRGVPVTPLRKGVIVRWMDARLEVLHSGGKRRKTDPINNQSVVAVFERHGRRVLLTGDIGAATERALLSEGTLQPVDILKVAHHGSRTSTTSEFVAAVRPKAALLSCGRRNRFGHPAAETLQTLGSFGVPIFRTDLCSDVRFELRPSSTRLSWRGLI